MSSTVSVHRCRFVDYTPTAITAIAFPPLPLPPVKGKKKHNNARSPIFGVLAVGRANGNIELHEWTGIDSQTPTPQAWVLQKILPGPVPSKVDNLVFTLRQRTTDYSGSSQLNNLRLFSTGGGSEVLEWDLHRGGIVQSVPSQAGSIWSMAANPSSTLLALGCEDGSVHILSLADNTLTHHRRFDRVKSRLLSISWGPPVPRHSSLHKALTGHDTSSSDEDEAAEWLDLWLVTGCSDSSLRKFDVASGRVLHRMTTDKSRGERTLVWAVGVLGDGTIVSGDSLGSVKFWDSNTCTQLQSFQTHGADVLCLTIGPEGRSVYTSGVDQKVCQFSNVQYTTATRNSSASTRSKWIHSHSRRLHSHDVRTIGVHPPYLPLSSTQRPSLPTSRNTPVLFSGGLDMSLVICPCALPSPNVTELTITNPLTSGSTSTFEEAYHRHLPYTIGRSPAVQLAREAKLVLCRRNTSLTVWKIHKSASPGETDLADPEVTGKVLSDDWEKVLDMDLKVRTNLVACAIASNGCWVAASDLHETKLFRLVYHKNEIQPKRVKLSEDHELAAAGATSLLFTNDSSKLIVGASMGSSVVLVVDLMENDNGSPRVLRSFKHHQMQNVNFDGSSSRVVKNLPSSPSLDGDLLPHVGDDLSIKTKKGSLQLLDDPPLMTTITCMATSMDGQWLASADTHHRIHVFNLDSVQHHCALPSFPHMISALSFNSGSPSILVIGLSNNTLQVFDVEARQFPDWSRSLSNTPFSHLHDPLLGISFDPDSTLEDDANEGRQALLWGSSWMCKMKLTKAIGLSSYSKKRRRESRRLSAAGISQTKEAAQEPNEDNFRLVTRYRPLLLADYLSPGELVVVERPLLDLLSTLPPAYFKSTYGS